MTKPVNVEWLQERVADLEAEVERLREALHDAEAIGDFPTELRDRLRLKEGAEAMQVIVAELQQALRRVVGALKVCRAELDEYHAIEEGRHQCPIQESHGMFLAEEALAFAASVMEKEEQ
jgi:SMC interacting uncharacterized protein involved in chromosome segregation